MYFPRCILVIAQVLSSFIVMLIGYSVVLIAIFIVYGKVNYSIAMLPLILIIMFFFVLGYSLFFSAVNVYSRDVQHFLSAISIIFYFLTPMYFTMDSISGLLRTVVLFNPFTYYVEAVHQIIYYGTIPEFINLGICLLLSILTMIVGYVVFKRLKNGFAERL